MMGLSPHPVNHHRLLDSKPLPTHYPILLSAHTPQVLTSAVANLKEFLETKRVEPKDAFFFRNLAYTLSLRRTHHSYRANFVTDSVSNLIGDLGKYTQHGSKLLMSMLSLSLA